MASDYRLQIVRRDGALVYTMEPGGKAERDIVEDLVARVKAKGIGAGRSEKHVLGAVRAAFDELMYDLKATIRP
jgi:hypothetical protein